MSSVEYDLDTSGGLMPQIQALIAPPISEDASKAKKKEGKELHPYYKRPGKGHNHDCCDACGEGGDLLCCDKCPASFHFQCHDPPLDEADLPIGEWLCHSCRMVEVRASKEGDSTTKEVNSRGRIRSTKRELIESNCGTSERRSHRDSSVAGSLEMLLRAAAAMNPRQFELPRELSTSLPFPGTDKTPNPTRIVTRRGSTLRKKPHELDNGMVPLPVKVCFECRRSCRKAPLIACDYCPLLFHQDCLDPPLASLPAGHWMCPNHAEHFLDSALLKSCSASERVRLWDHYSGPIDQDAIKVEFIRKANRRHPPFRYKVRLPPRGTVRVPDAVKAHYAKPPSLIPSLRDVLREEVAIASRQRCSSSLSTSICEQEQVLVNGEASVALHNAEMAEVTDSQFSAAYSSPVTATQQKTEKTSNAHTLQGPGCCPLTSTMKPTLCRTSTSSPLGCTSPVSSKMLTAHIQMLLESGSFNADLKTLDDHLVQLLALQRLQQLLPSSDTEPTQRVSSPSVSLPPESTVRARAVLCSLSGKGPPCLMPYRTLNVGAGADNDVVLGQYGYCNFISPRHAAIFFDETTQHFELLNYSEHGTTVDNVLFSCDFSEKPVLKVGNTSDIMNGEDLAAAVRAEVNLRRGLQPDQKSNHQPIRMAPNSGKGRQQCGCQGSGSSMIGRNGAGWEGTALLTHGSYIRFGCLQFVFSVTDYAPVYNSQHQITTTEVKQEPEIL